MVISIFTPTHDPTYLDEAYGSVLAQTYTDWEWIVLLNGDAAWEPIEPDDRIRVIRGETSGRVGAVKREACSHARGEILLELDHDDILTVDCLTMVAEAFTNPRCVFAYSDWTHVNADTSPNRDVFDDGMGWTYRADGDFLVCEAMAPTPHNLGYIWYAPNHVRAFHRDAYEAVDGYDPTLSVLDDQDLMTRLYQVGDFTHIPECLYLQRLHDGNTQRRADVNPGIQTDTVTRYWDRITDLYRWWSEHNGLLVVDVSPDWVGGQMPADLEPDTIGLIHCKERLQRVPDVADFLDLCWTALAPGGLLATVTPSTDGRGAFQDPTHTSYWNENSFWYLTQTHLRERVYPDAKWRWQTSGIRTTWHDHQIGYVEANLIAVKDGPRNGGPLL